MEHRLVCKNIKACQTIYYHPDYYLFFGKHLQSCSRQGGPLFTYAEVKGYLHSYAILPENKLLVTDSKGVYHILDLAAGKVLISRQMPRDVISTKRFAISDDGMTAYRIWLKGDKYSLVVIDLLDLRYQLIPYKSSLSCVADLIIHSQNELLVLESQVIDYGICRSQVTSVLLGSGECTLTPKYQWECDCCGNYFDGRYVLESGYRIRDLHTDHCFSILENSDILLPEKHVALFHLYYPESQYLQLIDGTQTLFIDCIQRKIIARYQRAERQPSYVGLYTGKEFWFGKPDGIYATPFPIIEGI